MTSPRPLSALQPPIARPTSPAVQPRKRLDERLDDIGVRPTVQPLGAPACLGVRVPGRPGARVHADAHARNPVGQVGRLDEENSKRDDTRGNLRQVMPMTAELIDGLRREFAQLPQGATYVDQLLREVKSGRRHGWFREVGPDGVSREFGRATRGGRT